MDHIRTLPNDCKIRRETGNHPTRSPTPSSKHRVLVTGATGYIGGRLVARLLDSGYQVCCLVRDPRKLESRPWFNHKHLSLTTGDAGDLKAVENTLQGCTVAYGEALDFWRVTGLEPNHSLDLHAEMKLPGEAKLSFRIEPQGENPQTCQLIQTARFQPRGLLGILYWYAVLPLHHIVFSGMLNGIRRAAENR